MLADIEYLKSLPVLDRLPEEDFRFDVSFDYKKLPYAYNFVSWAGSIGYLDEDRLTRGWPAILATFPGRLSFIGKSADNKTFVFIVSKSAVHEKLIRAKLMLLRFLSKVNIVVANDSVTLDKQQLIKIILYWLVWSVVGSISLKLSVVEAVVCSMLFTLLSFAVAPYMEQE